MEIHHPIDRLQPLGNGRKCIGDGCARVQYEPGLTAVDVHIDRNIPHKADGRRNPPHALGRTAKSHLPARKVDLDTGPAENVHADKAPDSLPYLLRQIVGVNVIKRNGCRYGKKIAVKVDEFRKTNPQFYADLAQYPQLADYLKDQKERIRTESAKFFERGRQEGYFREEFNPELVTMLFEALNKFVMENRLYQQYSFEEIFKNLAVLTLRGICTDKGLKLLDKLL